MVVCVPRLPGRNDKRTKLIFLLAVLIIVGKVVYDRWTPYNISEFQTPVNNQVSSSLFTYSLRKTMDTEQNVILAFIDFGYVDLGINLYLSSIKPLGLTNHLFLGSDEKVCPALMKVAPEANCVQVTFDKNSETANSFGSKQFTIKNWRKTKIVYEVLQLGFNVLLVDLDIVMFKNPFEFFDRCPTCDIQIQGDHVWLCGGFFYVKSTKHSLELFRQTWGKLHDFITGKTVMQRSDFNEQLLMTKIIKSMNKTVQGFKPYILSEKIFTNGNSYFMSRKSMFGTDGPTPPDVYIVHNNWIVYESSKIYRFKEHFLWYYDKESYYTDKMRKYLQYENPLDVDELGTTTDVHELEKASLQAALSLGFLLNRTVILPSFTCKGCLPSDNCHAPTEGRCALNAHFKLPYFQRYIGDTYREHTFLQNRLVPVTVKSSVSKTIVIESDFYKKHDSNFQLNSEVVDVFRPQDPTKGASVKELLQWFSGYDKVSVLKFHSLYKAIQDLPNISKYSDINKRVKYGVVLKVGNYMQGGNGKGL